MGAASLAAAAVGSCGDAALLLRYRDHGGAGAGAFAGAAGSAAAGAAGVEGGAPTAGAGGTPAQLPLGDCAPYTPGAVFSPCTATYLGGATSESLATVAIGADRAVVVAGSSTDTYVAPLTELLGGGAGVLLRYSHAGRQLETVTRLGQRVRHVVVAPGTGNLVVGGDFGVAVLTPTAGALIWRRGADGEVIRVAVSAAGAVAALTESGSVHVFAADSIPLGVTSVTAAQVEDVAIADEPPTFYVVGATVPASGCPQEMPFLRAHAFDGTLRYTRYDFATGGTWCAASRGRRVVVRGDELYYAGENEGGNTVHLRDPTTLDQGAPLVSYDAYTQSSGRAIEWYAFVARFERRTGQIVEGQVLLPRDADSVGGVHLVNALAVDERGTLYLGGQVSCCLGGRDTLQVGEASVGPYAAAETSVVMATTDLRERLSWVTWTNAGEAPSAVVDLAVGGELAAMVASSSATADGLLLVEPLQATPATTFLSTWRTP